MVPRAWKKMVRLEMFSAPARSPEAKSFVQGGVNIFLGAGGPSFFCRMFRNMLSKSTLGPGGPRGKLSLNFPLNFSSNFSINFPPTFP